MTGGTKAEGVRKSPAGEDIWAHAEEGTKDNEENECTEEIRYTDKWRSLVKNFMNFRLP